MAQTKHTDDSVFIPRRTRTDRRTDRHRDKSAWKREFSDHMAVRFDIDADTDD